MTLWSQCCSYFFTSWKNLFSEPVINCLIISAIFYFLFRTRWKNPYNVSHVLNRWSMTLFLPICERFTGRAKHYAPGRKKMLKPQSSFSIFLRKKIFIFYVTEERKYQSANNHICSRNRFFRGEDSHKIQKLSFLKI